MLVLSTSTKIVILVLYLPHQYTPSLAYMYWPTYCSYVADCSSCLRATKQVELFGLMLKRLHCILQNEYLFVYVILLN